VHIGVPGMQGDVSACQMDCLLGAPGSFSNEVWGAVEPPSSGSLVGFADLFGFIADKDFLNF